MTITEFLEARITEDEVAATFREWHADECAHIRDEAGYSYPCDCGVPERMAAECVAKRAIIKQHEGWPVLVESNPDFAHDENDIHSMAIRMTRELVWLTEREYVKRFGTEAPTTNMILALAAIYKDHPDYQKEWGQ